ESVRTTNTAGSKTRQAIGLRSVSAPFASLDVSGPAIQTLVTSARVFGSSFRSATAAAATAPLPPGLLITCMRTGRSFAFSIIVAIARASRSLPPPGPVWTMTSTVLVGFHCACAVPTDNSAVPTTAHSNFLKVMTSPWVRLLLGLLIEHLHTHRVEFLEQRNDQQYGGNRKQNRWNRPEQDTDVSLRHHQRLPQGLLHCITQHKSQYQRC